MGQSVFVQDFEHNNESAAKSNITAGILKLKNVPAENFLIG